TEPGLRGALWGMPDVRSRNVLRELGEPDSPVMELIRHGALQGGAPSLRGPGSFPPLDFRSFVVCSFRGTGDTAIGACFIEADAVDDRARDLSSLLNHLGPAFD